MLTSLTVSNFAIIDNISIDFTSHLTVLTGETGAGKSLIIDAIGLLLGGRASSTLIRSDCEKAIIEGIFEDYNPQINSILEEIGIDYNDDTLIVKREISKTGKSISRINGFVVTLNQLETISSLLADIHTQMDTKKLFDVRNYVEFIDNQVSKHILEEYKKLRLAYLNDYHEYNKLLKEAKTGAENLDFLKYRVNELKNLNLNTNELAQLEQELYVLNNYENIFNALSIIKESLQTNQVVKSLYDVKNALNNLTKIDSKYEGYKSSIESMYYDLDDIETSINNDLRKMEFDSDRLNEINNRLSILNDIQRKYKMNIDELLTHLSELEMTITNYDQSDFLINEAKIKLDKSFKSLVDKANELTLIRIANSKVLKNNIMDTLKDLCLDKVRLEIVFNEKTFNDFLNANVFKETGCDEIEFMVSFNPGEQLHPLSKVASGGEMSRVMLAFKTHILENANLSTIIFDEIDTGISGEVAHAVASKIKAISHKTQVLSITHLPIVASAADQHLFVSKTVNDGKTTTNIKKLTKDERIREIATMISSKKDEITSLLLAENMINSFIK